MKGKWAFVLLTFLSQCVSPDPVVPISVDIKVDKEYELIKSRDFFESTSQEDGYEINSDSVKQKYFDLTLEIHNNSDRSIGIWLMTCSYEENFIVNNNYIFIKGHPCDNNYPELLKFEPGEHKVYEMTVMKSIRFDYPCRNCVYGPQVETTKLGLILIDDLYESKLQGLGYEHGMEDKSAWTIVWSNSLNLFGQQPELKPLKN